MESEPLFPAVDVTTVVIEEADFRALGLGRFEEGLWKKAHGDYWVRVDPPNPSMKLLRHAHVAHQQHLQISGEQVAWNDDGSRHDRARFNTSFVGIEQAKEIVRAALKLGPNVRLESIPPAERVQHMLEAAHSHSPRVAAMLAGGTWFRLRRG